MAFATTGDIEDRLGRELTDAEVGYVTPALDNASSIIAEAAGRDDDWADALTPIPRILKELSIQMVIRAGQNPEGVALQREILGQYTKEVRFDVGDPMEGDSLFLSDVEGRLVRRVVFGRSSGSSTPDTLLDELPDWQNLSKLIEAPLGDDDVLHG